MKKLITSISKTPVNYDPELLKSNGIYLAATDNNKTYVDDLFQQIVSGKLYSIVRGT